ncbi:MAG: pantetheine-phosphate adenylyltransferase [Nitrospirae bacterium]|nr:pantetheine-phosphate adenylyltransferase [Nitrospirota bacterium]
MKRIAIVPGTFDPITNGHIDLVERSLRIFDRVIVAAAPNPKKKPLFTLDERLDLIRHSTSHLKGVTAEAFDGLLVEYVSRAGGVAIVRGLRAVSDFEYELQMALMNRRLNTEVETVFMMPSEEYSYITSTIIKEVASFGGRIDGLVSGPVNAALLAKLAIK